MNEMDDEYFMQQALKEARLAYEEDEVPIGAVVVMGGRIIARGHNQTERLTIARRMPRSSRLHPLSIISGVNIFPKRPFMLRWNLV